MSETPQDPDAGTEEGGYGYPTLEQEVTPDLLTGETEGSGEPETAEGDDAPTPGELEEDPVAVEPTD